MVGSTSISQTPDICVIDHYIKAHPGDTTATMREILKHNLRLKAGGCK